MGWAFCGKDDLGRWIGYGVDATCDFEGCEAKIDRGLGYICGWMHNADNEDGCGRYFCGEHQFEGENRHDCKERAFYWQQQGADELERIEGKPQVNLPEAMNTGDDDG